MSNGIEIKVVGDQAVIARLGRVQQSAYSAVKMALVFQTNILKMTVMKKLSGDVLNIRKGNLLRSIVAQNSDDGQVITGQVYGDTSVKYGAIHEFGGTIHVPEIVPVKAKSLAFEVKGALIFAMKTRALFEFVKGLADCLFAFGTCLAEAGYVEREALAEAFEQATKQHEARPDCQHPARQYQAKVFAKLFRAHVVR